MMTALAKAVLGLYPLAYRRRYGEEMRALIEEIQPGPRGVFDLLRGALRARIRPQVPATAVLEPSDRLSSSLNGILACWVVFGLSAFAFIEMTRSGGWCWAAEQHLISGASHAAVKGLVGIAMAVCAAAAFGAALRVGAQMEKGRALRSTAGLRGGMAAIAAIPIALLFIGNHGSGDPLLRIVLVDVATSLVVIVCAILVGRFVFADESEIEAYGPLEEAWEACGLAPKADIEGELEPLDDDLLYLAWPLAALGAAVMAIAAVAAPTYLAAILLQPGAENASGSIGSTVWVSLFVVAMMGAGAFATVSAARAWRAFWTDSNPFVVGRESIRAASAALQASEEKQASLLRAIDDLDNDHLTRPK